MKEKRRRGEEKNEGRFPKPLKIFLMEILSEFLNIFDLIDKLYLRYTALVMDV